MMGAAEPRRQPHAACRHPALPPCLPPSLPASTILSCLAGSRPPSPPPARPPSCPRSVMLYYITTPLPVPPSRTRAHSHPPSLSPSHSQNCTERPHYSAAVERKGHGSCRPFASSTVSSPMKVVVSCTELLAAPYVPRVCTCMLHRIGGTYFRNNGRPCMLHRIGGTYFRNNGRSAHGSERTCALPIVAGGLNATEKTMSSPFETAERRPNRRRRRCML
jgi:hypothetical protein